MILRPESALNALWAIWYVSWIAAAYWSARTTVQMKTDMGGWHRIASGFGAILLFWPHRVVNWAPGGGFFRFAFDRLWPSTVASGWVLFALAALGFAFCWWARLHLGKLWSGFVTLKEDHRIVDTGPYGLVRHPIYSGVMFAAVATASMRASPAAFAGAALIILGFSMTARIEEGFLRARLRPDAYDGYRRRVGMLLPRLG